MKNIIQIFLVFWTLGGGGGGREQRLKTTMKLQLLTGASNNKK